VSAAAITANGSSLSASFEQRGQTTGNRKVGVSVAVSVLIVFHPSGFVYGKAQYYVTPCAQWRNSRKTVTPE
jgi:hypothetical protein